MTELARRVAPGHAAVEVLEANGVEVVFGLNGDHILELYEGLADTPSIRHVTVKHENNAALAAEAYGRLTGRPGVALVTAGPGALNSISGVASALAAGAPLVHVSGAVPTGAALEAFHGVDVLDFTERAFAPVTKSSNRVTRAADVAGALTRAFELAVDGRPGPVHVEITRDVLEGEPFDSPPPRPARQPSAALAPGVERALERLRAARRPLIVASKGAWYPAVSAALVELAEALGAPVAHTWEGHGAIPTVHPLSLGPYRIMQSHPAVLAELGAADLVLGIGVRAGTEVDRALRADFAGKLVVLDAADTSDTFPRVHASSVPSLAASLRELARLVGPRADAGAVRERCAEARRRLAGGIDVELERHAGARPWHIGLAVRALDQRMTPDLVVTSDVSNVKLWVPFQLRAFGPHSHVQAGSWGTMGYALPAAIGAAMACPGRKVVGLAGDASFLMSTSDLVTIAQHRLPIVLGVHHDGQIGMINYMQRMAGRAPYATEVGDVDYAKHAEAAGVRGIRVQEPDEIGPAWDAALAHHGPVLIEFMAGHDFPRPSVTRFVEQGREEGVQ
ncbi:MAG TPA: thiamine pyrophosphate-binding protein [Chloroflexota bacterium]|jgi:acetolactate synthase-1/2/3 large subunit|nr:thiamine pyrophosphate-binding protein [Chloroflexota bacterium]